MCTNCTLFLMGAVPWCYLCSTFEPNCMTTMKRMLNRMLRYADAIVKRGVDKLIDAIGHSPEPQAKNTETPQPQKRIGNDTDCPTQTTESDDVRRMWCSMRFAANAENIRTKGHKNKRASRHTGMDLRPCALKNRRATP